MISTARNSGKNETVETKASLLSVQRPVVARGSGGGGEGRVDEARGVFGQRSYTA